jgi:hypothetical protein
MSILDCPFGFPQSLFNITTRNKKRTYSLRCSGRVNINRLGYGPWQSFHFQVLSPFMTYHLITRRVPLVEQQLLTLLEQLSSTPVFSEVRVNRSLVLCVYLVDRCLFFCTFLLATVLSILLRFTDSDYPYGIFKHFYLPYYKCKAASVILNGLCYTDYNQDH